MTANLATPLVPKILYDRRSAAYSLSVSIRSLDYLVANRQINTVRLGSKVMFAHSELVKFARQNHSTITATEGAE